MPNSDLTVCAIVPVYNVERYLDRCVNSLLAQTRAFNQIILVDDGATDQSGAMCDVYAKADGRIEVIHQENRGLSAARNAAIAINRCDYVTFVDSDDWIAPSFVYVMISLIEETNCDVAMCGHARVSSEADFSRLPKLTGRTKIHTQDEWLRVLLRFDGNRAVHYAWGKFYAAKLLDDELFPVGMLNEDVEGAFKVSIRASTVAETNEILYAYYVNEQSITGKKFGDNYLCLPEVWHRVDEIARNERPDLAPMTDYNVKRADFTVLCDALIHGDNESDRLYDERLSKCRKRLKKNLPILLRGPMDVKRKLSALALALLGSFATSAYRLIHA